MLADKPLNCLLPQEPATMQGRSVIQWSKEDIEALGFFKIDILSLGMLSAMRKCFDYIEFYYGENLGLGSIPDDDQATYQMIQKADTVGVFQIESRAQMSMLPRLKPACFYDLVIEVAIIRPGPIQGEVIHPYLARRDGLEPVTYPDERLRPILQRTLGIAIFQEQAMRIAIAVGNFTAGEANELRKKIGSWGIKDFNRDLNPLLIKLEQGMRFSRVACGFVFVDRLCFLLPQMSFPGRVLHFGFKLAANGVLLTTRAFTGCEARRYSAITGIAE
jgi:error-prone DNA polymerase